MTREEAIDLIKGIRHGSVDALGIVLNILEQEPCDDAISRDAVYSILKEYHIDEEEIESAMDECQNLTVNSIISDVSLLPSVTQKLKTGHWILTDDDFVYCSECEDSYYPRPIDASWYYCPHCGTKMVEPQESEE